MFLEAVSGGKCEKGSTLGHFIIVCDPGLSFSFVPFWVRCLNEGRPSFDLCYCLSASADDFPLIHQSLSWSCCFFFFSSKAILCPRYLPIHCTLGLVAPPVTQNPAFLLFAIKRRGDLR